MAFKLYPFQREGVRLMEEAQGRVLLADSMGLGKSVQTLRYITKNDLFPAVVICPASMKWVWRREALDKFNLKSQVLEGTYPNHKLRKDRLIICNYDILGKTRNQNNGPGWLGELQRLQPEIVVADEFHYCSGRSTKRTRWVRNLCEDVNKVIGLTGTPMYNHPVDLWSLLNIIRPDIFDNFYKFAHKFCGPRKERYGWTYKGATNLPELYELLKGVMIRRRKEDVLDELPDKTISVVPFQLSGNALKEYKELQSDFIRWLNRTDPLKVSRAERAKRLTQLGYLIRLTGWLKIPQVERWVDDFLLESEEKLILFAIHKRVVKRLHEKYKNTCVVVDGDTPQNQRERLVDAFSHDPRKRVFIGNVQAAGVGLNLQVASSVAFAEFAWVPSLHTQAIDRSHRIGQKNSVNAYFLTTMGTIEEKLLKINQSKQLTFDEVIDGGECSEFRIHDMLCKMLQEDS